MVMDSRPHTLVLQDHRAAEEQAGHHALYPGRPGHHRHPLRAADGAEEAAAGGSGVRARPQGGTGSLEHMLQMPDHSDANQRQG